MALSILSILTIVACTQAPISNPKKAWPGSISSEAFSENVISFTSDEQTAFFTRTNGWEKQMGYLARKEGDYFASPVALVALDSIYNGAISPDGQKILFSIRTDTTSSIWLAEKTDNRWSTKNNLSQNTGLSGGYFYWLNNREVYFYVPASNGDIVQAILENQQLTITDSLTVINTTSGTEFSPFVDRKKRYLIFSRYTEGDITQQGFFISYNEGQRENPRWSIPQKLDMLPYGWSSWVSEGSNQFIFSDGEDIYSYPVSSLPIPERKTATP